MQEHLRSVNEDLQQRAVHEHLQHQISSHLILPLDHAVGHVAHIAMRWPAALGEM